MAWWGQWVETPTPQPPPPLPPPPPPPPPLPSPLLAGCKVLYNITVMSHEHFSISNHRHLGCFFNSLFTVTTKNMKASRHWSIARGIYQLPVVSPHKGQVMKKAFPCHDMTIIHNYLGNDLSLSLIHFGHHLFTDNIGCEITIVVLSWLWWFHLTHWGWDKMDAIFQTTFSYAFSWMKMYKFWIRFHWCLFQGVQLTKSQHWFR